MYVVLNSERGLEVVPEGWLFNGSNNCQYPPFKSNTALKNAVKDKIKPADDWYSFQVDKIYGRYGSFYL